MFAIKPYAPNINDRNKVNFGHRDIDPDQIVLSDPDTITTYLIDTQNIRQKNLVDDGIKGLPEMFKQALEALGVIRGKSVTKEEEEQIKEEAKRIRINLGYEEPTTGKRINIAA